MRTVNPKTALVLGGFGQRQPTAQLITLSCEMGVELVSVPKFTQQIRRCYSIDTLKDKDRFKEVTTRLQMGLAKYDRKFFCLSRAALN